MSTRTLLIDVAANGRLDGQTFFNLPSPLAAPDANGNIVVDVNAGTGACGRLSQADPVFKALVGSGGFWLRQVTVDGTGGAATEMFVALGQPQPTLTLAGARILQSDPIHTVGNANILNVGLRREGPYVPAGWEIILYQDAVGPCQVSLELETLPETADAARAIKAQKFRIPTADALA